MKESRIDPRVCPRCGAVYAKPPALSRLDNQTYICPDCGTREALAAMGLSPEEQEKILEIIHAHHGS